ncbi:sodium- and chloride-dependent GABA transporter ine isoform X1 [Pseudomyrmex gracilis]|uniref:sodium- and chloride-dependent GABA transporter ine isoform X1 n=1 Tax=Pseudomyrmex gracilis TaxID=219809 RepID=UPI000994FEF0|nr:sodium- and chloride-dependent GABA transporter ine isoform X1 [Pseudomyrmex gracilis]XP_020283661.1 sodium- and chloride-dependent GABA transporter ine isoform X1 [Pseudomyrmex gracilis]XP_020283662.1 sodium- and chloride-dependent GABA transporter ine isoform X1 [Pseudomyrmex gracilis]XP_020283663.1 sodium- and chloride-dependent GABA transporter ine isoform X1 [Pseudomyrmex gracilis]XP_020283664.1 sodium- and chloride-dependent GABA transporter ine isoform X1 [Pseudomyrmex gracilis]
MNTEISNNDGGITETPDSCTPVSSKHGDVTGNKLPRRQIVRKMSTMLEEEDAAMSDDTDPDVIKIGNHQQKRPEEIEWSTDKERGRLLNSVGHKIVIAPTSATGNGNVRRTISRDRSPESVQERSHHHRWQSRLANDLVETGSSRDNGLPQSPGRASVKSIDHLPPPHRQHCVQVPSRISNAIMDENQQHCPCCHQSSSSWSSVLYADANGVGQTRLFSDTVSIRSVASIGLGSSDGRKLTIRRVPTSPTELLNVVHPPPFEDDVSTYTSYDDGDADDLGDYRQPRRPHWANKVQFVLACIGYSVGLGNVWRFPYLCYKSGGGVFLVPYFLILIVCGVPLLYMELSIGQFTRRGPIGALGQVCPLLKGAGLSSVVISFLLSTYHNVIIAYAIYYFFAAFRAEQPWTRCDNSWNTPRCWLPSYGFIYNRTRPNSTRTPSEEFFDNKVLQMSNGIEEPGALRWELVACLITAWIMVYFSIWKSIKSSAQVRYLTATLPFLLIIVFLTRSLTLEGAAKGLRFFFHPRWELLGDAKVWINAAAQVFNSGGIAFGSMICFASYNRFHNTILVDTVSVSLINAFSSLLVGIFSFATIGNIALEQNTSVEDVLTDGPGLVFVVYPQALAKMPASQLWAVLFFFMLVCLSLNSQFAVVEVVVTSIQDGFPKWVKRHLLCHEVLVLLICVVSFLFGLPNITQGGIYFFQLIDHYAASMSIMFLAFFEVIALSWLYGVRRLCSNVKEMTGRVPSMYFRFCWFIAAPFLIMAVWVFNLIDYESPTYHNGDYVYPWWAETIGWSIASLSLICIPAFAVCVLVRADGATFAERLKNSIKPHFEACKVCGQEYCIEPMHNVQDDIMLKEPETDVNTSVQLNSHYLLKPQM